MLVTNPAQVQIAALDENRFGLRTACAAIWTSPR
jgi:hypothetical protein